MNKKGDLLALRSLAVFLLSTFAVLLVFSLLFSVIQLTPPNVDIAKSNVESFSNFVDYSIDNTNGKNNCYSVMRIEHLMNYQGDEDNSYFYVLNSNGIGRAKMTSEPKFYEDLENYEFLIDDFEEFDSQLKLYIDKTDSGSEWLTYVGLEFLDPPDVNLNIQEEEIKHILIIPTFTTQNSYDVVIVSNKKIIGGRNGKFRETDTERIEGRFLVFASKGQDSGLFITEDINSDFIVQSQLCSSVDRGST